MSADGQQCINLNERYYITYDGQNVDFNDTAYSLGLNNTYCYSYDSQSCRKDYGPDCDLATGDKCSKDSNDGVSLLNGTYCLTLDN